MDDLIGISANDSMHFAWYGDQNVSAGTSRDLGNKRTPYPFVLATGAGLTDWITDMIDIVYEEISYPPAGTKVDEFYHTTYNNPAQATIKQTVKHSTSKTSTFEFYLKETLKTGLKASIKPKIPFLAEAAIEANAELGLESGQKWTITEQRTYAVDTVIKIPPESSVEVAWTVDWNDDIRIPFALIIKVTATRGPKSLATSELVSELVNSGFEGTIVDRSKPNEITVSLGGEFSGAYGMRSNVSTKSLA